MIGTYAEDDGDEDDFMDDRYWRHVSLKGRNKLASLDNLGDLAAAMLHRCVVHSVMHKCRTLDVRMVSEFAARQIARAWMNFPELSRLLRNDYEVLVCNFAEHILEMSAEFESLDVPCT